MNAIKSSALAAALYSRLVFGIDECLTGRVGCCWLYGGQPWDHHKSAVAGIPSWTLLPQRRTTLAATASSNLIIQSYSLRWH